MFNSAQTDQLENLAKSLTELVEKKIQNNQCSNNLPLGVEIIQIQKNLDNAMLRFHELSLYVKKNSESIFLLSFFQVLMKKIWSRKGLLSSSFYRKDLDAFEETYHRGLRGDVYLHEFFSAVFLKSKCVSTETGKKIKKTVIFRRLQHFFRDLAKRHGPSVSDCRSNSDIRIFGSGIKVLEFIELRECLFRTQDSLVKFAWWIFDRPTSDPRLQTSFEKISKKRKLAAISYQTLQKEDSSSSSTTENIAVLPKSSLSFEDIPDVPNNINSGSFSDPVDPFELEECLKKQQDILEFPDCPFFDSTNCAGEKNDNNGFVFDIFS